jgi:hypothetical protein
MLQNRSVSRATNLFVFHRLKTIKNYKNKKRLLGLLQKFLGYCVGSIGIHFEKNEPCKIQQMATLAEP